MKTFITIVFSIYFQEPFRFLERYKSVYMHNNLFFSLLVFSQKEEISGHCTFLTILLDLDTLDKDIILKPVYVEQKEIQNFIQNSLEQNDQMKIQIVNQLLNKLHEFR